MHLSPERLQLINTLSFVDVGYSFPSSAGAQYDTKELLLAICNYYLGYQCIVSHSGRAAS